MVSGLSHMTFIVRDLERSASFFEEIFGAREVYSSGDKSFSCAREKFLLINELWVCLMEGAPVAERSYNHVAFHIPDGELEDYIARLRSAGAEIKPPRARVEGEGHSVYFYDYDNHLFELHTGTLEERLKCYAQGERNED